MEIKVAHWRVKLITQQEEIFHQEEFWTAKVGSFKTSQEAINKEIEQEWFELNANQTTIDRASETIAKTQAILKATQLK